MRVDFKYDRERPKITIPEGFILIQDTREQLPIFKPEKWIVDYHLKTGDYSVKGLEDLITIERKSVSDLFGSLGNDRKRFDKVLNRMYKMKWAGLMIEGCEDKVMRKQTYAKMEVNQIYHSISSIEVNGIHVYYAKKKQDARDWILSRLTRFYIHAKRGEIL